ncbi:uncharacterized protein LOC110391625 [Numida meleagris]|uniref:uncharacterized protein LOC110391625 n=1 Tax=Numida meleagris TaxID=8996 RepID=UPI000B3E19C1|nr:uncharacterized protein LOC110391625 [Numida meleagris]
MAGMSPVTPKCPQGSLMAPRAMAAVSPRVPQWSQSDASCPQDDGSHVPKGPLCPQVSIAVPKRTPAVPNTMAAASPGRVLSCPQGSPVSPSVPTVSPVSPQRWWPPLLRVPGSVRGLRAAAARHRGGLPRRGRRLGRALRGRILGRNTAILEQRRLRFFFPRRRWLFFFLILFLPPNQHFLEGWDGSGADACPKTPSPKPAFLAANWSRRPQNPHFCTQMGAEDSAPFPPQRGGGAPKNPISHSTQRPQNRRVLPHSGQPRIPVFPSFHFFFIFPPFSLFSSSLFPLSPFFFFPFFSPFFFFLPFFPLPSPFFVFFLLFPVPPPHCFLALF